MSVAVGRATTDAEEGSIHAQAPGDRRVKSLARLAPNLVGSRGSGFDPGRFVRGDAQLGAGHPVYLDGVVCAGLARVLRLPGDDDLVRGAGLHALVDLALSSRAPSDGDRPALP